MTEFLLSPDHFPPHPSHHPPQIPFNLPSPARCFLFLASLYIMSGMCVDPIMAKHVFAYNCDKASFGIDHNLTSLFKNSYAHSHAEHSHVPFFSYIHHSLRTSDVFYAHNTYGNKTTDTVYVRHHDNIYFLKCKPELVTIIKMDKCFANQIVRVLDGNGNEK